MTGDGDENGRVAIVPIRRKGETLEMFEKSKDLKKEYSVRLGGGNNYPLRMEMVFCFFDIPLKEAARIMHVSSTLLKKIRTWVHVDQWPCSLVHTNGFGLTRTQIIKGRDEVISGLELEHAYSKEQIELSLATQGLELSLTIMKELREYAAQYAGLVIPGVGRRPMIKRKRILEESVPSDEFDIAKRKRILEESVPSDEFDIAKRMPPTEEMETTEDWPIFIGQGVGCVEDVEDVEDVLGLGPLDGTF